MLFQAVRRRGRPDGYGRGEYFFPMKPLCPWSEQIGKTFPKIGFQIPGVFNPPKVWIISVGAWPSLLPKPEETDFSPRVGFIG
jgi:hypothetical protein